MKRVVVFSESSENEYSVIRFKEEAKRLGIALTHFKYSQLDIEFKDNVYSLKIDGVDVITEFDYFILRSSKGEKREEFGYLTGIIKHLAHEDNKYVLNYEFSTTHRNWCNKIHNYFVLADNNLPVINTKIYTNLAKLEVDKSNLKFPLIAKNARGSHGDGVSLINSYDELVKYFEKNNIYETLVQDFIDSKEDVRWDIRIITLGKEVLGGFKRIVGRENITTNIASGGMGEIFELDENLTNIAKKIIEIFDAEYTGIDIMFDGDKPLILEVNKSPQFKGFETTTKVNVAGKILEYVISH